VRRWQAFTGKNARLASTGQTFEEVEDERLNGDGGPSLAGEESEPAEVG
jgi:hypothetical protein